ncbi:hypothetical protein [Couchioplanes caeruleus]|uniref:Guanylate cyclase domain-containing protein n=2 Tax=Couchioplanes caeruleus TaxID=56438 RepID=A0A1K0GLK7_9ACTN|nr:hypothetical protein [Couchioplanes caeruleus]OJF10067.1 hypothetical protein BG844_34040 [Couchioplanes caeruleus subsp. caeruleus]ROP31368.1 hypothetical protein EDD30_4267 [Couchioplanes caeruleus]
MPDPIFHFIVVVDVEGFGRRKIPAQAALRKVMYEVVEQAFEDVKLEWDAVVRLDRGDSIIMLLPASSGNNVTLAGPFIRALDAGLREKGRMYTADHQMRMRVALHQGNCQRDETGWVGEAINTSTRLVDAPELRATLKKATASMMAFIVSDEIYRSVIRHDFRQIDSASFAPVQLHVKELHEKAWIHVPGYSYPPDVEASPAVEERPAPPPPRRHGEGNGNSGGFTFHGDVHVEGDQFTGDKTVHGERR